MTTSKAVLVCLDALDPVDIDTMRGLPNLGRFLRDGASVTYAEPEYPSLTYPCHTSILTGNHVGRHGITHNQQVEVGRRDVPAFTQRASIQGDTLLDAARRHGRSTCSLSWPVTGAAEFDLNMPMIVPMFYDGPEPIRFLEGNATAELLERYYPKYWQYLTGAERSLDHYTMALTREILRDYDQPDVMLIKLCDLDTVRHANGVDNEHTRAQLAVHDEQLGEIIGLIDEHGDLANTNVVIIGDHGQSDVTGHLNLNVLFKRDGLLEVDGDDQVVDHVAFAHSAELSAWVQLADGADEATRARVHRYLDDLAADPQYGIGAVYTADEIFERFRSRGPWDFVVEGTTPVEFSSTWLGDDPFAPQLYKGSTAKATHGGLPFRDPTTLVAYGPGFAAGAALEHCQVVDVAPTLAALLGIELDSPDGRVLTELVA